MAGHWEVYPKIPSVAVLKYCYGELLGTFRPEQTS